MTKIYPDKLTTYDIAKNVAVILMIVDHIGYYLFPGEEWWRVFGRMCVPVWFFLIGFARSRDLGKPLWVGAGILVLSNVVAGMSIFPLNILGTILIVRLFLDDLVTDVETNRRKFWVISAALFLLVIPGMMVAEYGTQGMILAIFGYLCRQKLDNPDYKPLTAQYFVFAVASFVFWQATLFDLTQIQFSTMIVGVFIVMSFLFFFEPMELKKLSNVTPAIFRACIKLTGRHSLAIYVWHLIILKFAGMITDSERFGFFDWKFFSMTGT